MPPDTLYADDLVRWTAREADALRQAARAGSDLQPSCAVRAGEHARDLVRRRLDDSPSLRPQLAGLVADEIRGAKRVAIRSLKAHGEVEAARAVEDADVSLTADEVLDDGYVLPETRFSRAAGREGDPA